MRPIPLIYDFGLGYKTIAMLQDDEVETESDDELTREELKKPVAVVVVVKPLKKRIRKPSSAVDQRRIKTQIIQLLKEIGELAQSVRMLVG